MSTLHLETDKMTAEISDGDRISGAAQKALATVNKPLIAMVGAIAWAAGY